MLALAASLPAQEILLFEDFDGQWNTEQPPAGWTIFFQGAPERNDWGRVEANEPPWEGNNTPYAVIDSTRPLETGEDSMITPSFDCMGHSNITLRCSTFFKGSIGAYESHLLGSVDNGPFDIQVFDYSGSQMNELQVIDLPWAAEQSEVRLAWVFTGSNDMIDYWAIDNVTVLGTSGGGGIDVGVEMIIAPRGASNYNTIISPTAIVHNFGEESASFMTLMTIGLGYVDSAQVENLEPGESTPVVFMDWLAEPNGQVLQVSAQTMLDGDENPDNDRADTTTTVSFPDLTPYRFLVPADTVDSGTVITPTVEVVNVSERAAGGFSCSLSGSDGYFAVAEVDPMYPGETREVTFPGWTLNIPGGVVARCSIMLADADPSNDTLSKLFFVRGGDIVDVAALRVLSPSGAVLESTMVVPIGEFRNNGQAQASVTVSFAIHNSLGQEVFSDQYMPTIEPGDTDTAYFAAWTAFPRGSYVATFSVNVSGDVNPANDTTRLDFEVSDEVHDVGVDAILNPIGSVQEGQVTPRVRFRNHGNTAETFAAWFTISEGSFNVYEDTLQLTVPPHSTWTDMFDPWSATSGNYTARCTTMLPGDANPANDMSSNTFRVETLTADPGWHEVASIPTAPSGKPVKRGGALTTMPTGDGISIFALKGNKTGDFYSYDPAADRWNDLPPMPDGPDGRQVRKGGRLCGDGECYIYATKGNNTQEFYRYNTGDSSWAALADVPLGLTGKKVKGGTDMVYVTDDTTAYVYLLKGYKTDFFRFNTVTQTWDTALPPAPIGLKEKWDKGSFLVFDGEHYIYAHKAKYYDKTTYHHEMWRFDISTGEWGSSALTGMPLYGLHGGSIKKKKAKDGACGAWVDDADPFLVALKGGNTQQFWKYLPARDSWVELDTVPTNGSTNKKKRIKYGADIVGMGDGTFFALKGNKTYEFWRYRFGSPPGISDGHKTRLPAPDRSLQLAVRPNPARVSASLMLPTTAPTVIRLYDVNGNLRRTWLTADNRGTATLGLTGLAPGIYLVQARQGDRVGSTKLIIE
jgi:hypothetical protein